MPQVAALVAVTSGLVCGVVLASWRVTLMGVLPPLSSVYHCRRWLWRPVELVLQPVLDPFGARKLKIPVEPPQRG